MFKYRNSSDFLSELWPSSATLRERYKNKFSRVLNSESCSTVDTNARLGSLQRNDPKKFDGFEESVELLRGKLIDSYTNRNKHLDSSFKLALHSIYVYLLRDGYMVFDLLESGTLLLLARKPIKFVPSNAIEDLISIFDLLLTEMTKLYDDSSQELSDDFKISSKVFSFFLISCSRYNTLSRSNLDQLAQFVLKLTQYSLSMSMMVEYWFQVASKEPDSMLILHHYKLDQSYFPIYDISKDFLFMDDNLRLQAREVLLHIVLITEYSEELKEWLLASDFPNLVITGLHSSFSQLSYNESLVSIEHNVEMFVELDQYLNFVANVLCYSTQTTIRFVFVHSLEQKFFRKIVEYYYANVNYKSNIVFLICYTLSSLILLTKSEDGSSIIMDDLVSGYFKTEDDNGSQLLIVLIDYILSDEADIICKSSVWDLLTSILHTGALDVVSLSEPSQKHLVSKKTSYIFHRLAEMIEFDQTLKQELIDTLDKALAERFKTSNFKTEASTRLHKEQRSQLTSVFITILFNQFANYFQNESTLNKSITCALAELEYLVGDKTFGDSAASDRLTECLDYHWDCLKWYTSQLKGSSYRPRSATNSINILSPERLDKLIHKLGDFEDLALAKTYDPPYCENVNINSLLSNIQIFKSFTISLFAIHEARRITSCSLSDTPE